MRPMPSCETCKMLTMMIISFSRQKLRTFPITGTINDRKIKLCTSKYYFISICFMGIKQHHDEDVVLKILLRAGLLSVGVVGKQQGP